MASYSSLLQFSIGQIINIDKFKVDKKDIFIQIYIWFQLINMIIIRIYISSYYYSDL